MVETLALLGDVKWREDFEERIASALAVRDATIAGLRADLTAALTRADVAERERDEARAALAAEHGGYIGGNLS